MKITAFILTILIQFLSLLFLNLLDNFYLVILLYLACLVTGLLIRLNSSAKPKVKAIGWGLLFGSLTTLALILLLVILLSYNFPK